METEVLVKILAGVGAILVPIVGIFAPKFLQMSHALKAVSDEVVKAMGEDSAGGKKITKEEWGEIGQKTLPVISAILSTVFRGKPIKR